MRGRTRANGSERWLENSQGACSSNHYDIDTSVTFQHAIHLLFSAAELAGPVTDWAKIFDEAGCG
jgi:hypothetical protein